MVTQTTGQTLDDLCINTVRFLAVDAVEQAGSGHPGTPMGAAAMAYVLWDRFLKHDPTDPAQNTATTTDPSAVRTDPGVAAKVSAPVAPSRRHRRRRCLGRPHTAGDSLRLAGRPW